MNPTTPPEDPSSKTFSIHVVGETTGETWTGDFTVKTRLSKIEQCLQDNAFRFYLGESNPQYASVEVQSIATVLSQLKVRITKAPKWWEEAKQGERLEDDAVLKAVYDGAMKAEADYRKDLKERQDKARDELRALTLGSQP